MPPDPQNMRNRDMRQQGEIDRPPAHRPERVEEAKEAHLAACEGQEDLGASETMHGQQVGATTKRCFYYVNNDFRRLFPALTPGSC